MEDSRQMDGCGSIQGIYLPSSIPQKDSPGSHHQESGNRCHLEFRNPSDYSDGCQIAPSYIIAAHYTFKKTRHWKSWENARGWNWGVFFFFEKLEMSWNHIMFEDNIWICYFPGFNLPKLWHVWIIQKWWGYLGYLDNIFSGAVIWVPAEPRIEIIPILITLMVDKFLGIALGSTKTWPSYNFCYQSVAILQPNFKISTPNVKNYVLQDPH